MGSNFPLPQIFSKSGFDAQQGDGIVSMAEDSAQVQEYFANGEPGTRQTVLQLESLSTWRHQTVTLGL